MKNHRSDFGQPAPGRLSRLALVLSCTASLLALTSIANPALAQSNDGANAGSETEVVVSGIRRSLKNAQQIKQSADVIVDSVTAEDIGALPDRSVTEALQRIPGVSINRFAAGVDPDHFSVEGSGVTVRGLNLTRSELNGRDSFSANNGRALSFADVPSELMAGVDVFKNPSADMIEGGIAGSINLRTRVPFDSKKQQFSISAESSYGNFAKESKPTLSALWTNSWDTDMGKFGLLLNFVDSKLATRSDGTQISNYACRTNVGLSDSDTTCGGIYYPRGAAIRSQTTERERKGYGLAAQWKSTDDTMLATFQYLRSEATQAWTEHAIEVATDNVADNGDSFPVFGSSLTADSTGLFQSGTLSSLSTGWRDDVGSGRGHRTPLYGLQSNNILRNQKQTYMTEDASFNFKWTPNAQWGFKLDVQHVNSNVDNLDNTIWGSSYQDAQIQLRGNDVPIINFVAPTTKSASGAACDPANPDWSTGAGCGNYLTSAHPSYTDPYNNFWRAAMDHAEVSEGTEDAIRLDAEYSFTDNDWLQAIDFGVRWSERDQTTRFSIYNWGALSESWGGGGQVWMDENLGTSGTSSVGKIANFGFENFMNGATPVPTNATRPYYAGNTVDNQAAFYAFALSVGDTWRSRNGSGTCHSGAPAPQNWVPLGMRCDVLAGTNFLPSEVNPINEVNNAAYLMLKYKHVTESGMKIAGNVGVRFTQTERSSSGYHRFGFSSGISTDCTVRIDSVTGLPIAPTPFCELSLADRNQVLAFLDGATTKAESNIKYSYVLPSFNLRLSPRPDVNIRIGLSKTLTPPDIGLVRNYYNVNLDTFNKSAYYNGLPSGVTTAGNPRLKPTSSDNIDLSVEWYFAPVGSLTLALYKKTLHDVVSNGTERVSFTHNGATFTNVVTTPFNSTVDGKVNGWEIAYTQTYDMLPAPWNGLGVNANYSRINSTGVPQSTLSATDPDVAAGRVSNIDATKLPLQGLSKDNMNLAVFYEKYGISARLAYNYRSDFLVTVRDVIEPWQPIMQAGGGQLDGSFFYQLTPQIKIGVQGQNLTNQITRTKAVIDIKGDTLIEAGRSWFVNDSRVDFIVRATF